MARIEIYRVCGGSMKVIAYDENPLVIKKILTHLRGKGLCLVTGGLPERATARRFVLPGYKSTR